MFRRPCFPPMLVLALVISACRGEPTNTVDREASSTHLAPTGPNLTKGVGSASTLLGRTTFGDPTKEEFKVKRISGDWHFEMKAKPAFDIAVQTIDFAPGSYSGWHGHPGPVFIQVVSGTMTFYEGDDPTCTPIVKSAGEGFLDLGEGAHIARNESGAPARNVVTYFAPPGAVLRIDKPSPGNCPF